MPRAGHDLAVDPTFGQRTALVRTGVFDRIEGSVDVKNRDLATADGKRFGLPRRNLRRGRDRYERWQCLDGYCVLASEIVVLPPCDVIATTCLPLSPAVWNVALLIPPAESFAFSEPAGMWSLYQA